MTKRSWKILSLTLLTTLLILLSACGGSGDSEIGTRPSGKALSFEEAAQKVIDEVVKPDGLDHEVIVFGWSDILTPDDELRAYAADDFTIPGKAVSFTVDSWFFWVDDFPGALFVHPTRFVLVSAETGEISSSVLQWWLVVNSESLFVDDDTYWDESIWIYSNLEWKPTPKAFPTQSLKSAVPIKTHFQGGETDAGHGLVVHGWANGQSGGADLEASAFQMSIFLRNSGFDTTTIGTESQDRPGEIIDWLMKKSEVVKPGETVMIYLAGHGGETEQTGAILLGQHTFWETDLVNWLDFFDPGVHVIVVVDACFSGSWIDGLRTVADVTITSTSAYDYAYTDIDSELDPNHDDIGTEFSSGFGEDWNEILNDTAQQEEARRRAQNPDTSYWQEVSALSYLSAVEKDYAHIKGLSFPNLVRGDASTRVSPIDPLLNHVNASSEMREAIVGNLQTDEVGAETVSVPSWLDLLFMPSVDLNFFEAFWAAFDPNSVLNWFNQSYFECGVLENGVLTVCPPGAGPMPEGDVLILLMVLEEDVPLEGNEFFYIYSAVLDSDGDPGNDFQYMEPYTWDYYQGTDLWYVLYWDYGDWTMDVSDYGNSIWEASSNARAAIVENIVVFFIPADEISSVTPGYRLSAFGNDGQIGDGHVNGDVSGVDPTVPPLPVPQEKGVIEE